MLEALERFEAQRDRRVTADEMDELFRTVQRPRQATSAVRGSGRMGPRTLVSLAHHHGIAEVTRSDHGAMLTSTSIDWR